MHIFNLRVNKYDRMDIYDHIQERILIIFSNHTTINNSRKRSIRLFTLIKSATRKGLKMRIIPIKYQIDNCGKVVA